MKDFEKYAEASGVIGEIHQPTAEKLARARVLNADQKLKRLMPKEGVIWRAAGK